MAYVNDIAVKSRVARTLIQDLEETFTSLRQVDLRLNPEKCVFGVPSGKPLGFLVSHRGGRGESGECQGNRIHEPAADPQGNAKARGLCDLVGALHLKAWGARPPILQADEEEGHI